MEIDQEKVRSAIIGQFQAFIDRAENQLTDKKWLEDEFHSIFVRKAVRLIKGNTITCLDIPNISINPNYQRQGLFKDFVMEAHQLHPWEGTYLENVYNQIIVEWCRKNNWTKAPDPLPDYSYPSPPSYYLLK